MEHGSMFENGVIRATTALGLFLFLTFSISLTILDNGTLYRPPESGDGPDYDNIAFNLWRGRGFGYDWNNAEWRAPYEASGDPQFEGLLKRSGEYRPTAQRPAVYPFVLAISYKLFGRRFDVPRVINAACFAGAAALVFALVWRINGPLAAGAFGVLVARDPTFAFWSYYLYAEAVAVLLLAASIWIIGTTKEEDARFRTRCLALGILLGLLILTKHIFIFVAPVLLVYATLQHSKKARSVLMSSALLVLVVMLAGWGLRNSVALGHFLPLGTQGGMNLAVDYSDSILDADGIWTSRSAAPLQRAAAMELDPSISDPVDREVAMNAWGTRQAVSWVGQNVMRVPTLLVLKVRSLFWNDALLFQRFIFILSLPGVLLLARRRQGIHLVVLLANTAAVAVTHNVPAGRFLLPAELSLIAITSVAISTGITAAAKVVSARFYAARTDP